MSIIALVSMRQNETPDKKQGDIIQVELQDAVFGTSQTKNYIRIKLDDSQLEQKLNDIAITGEPHPVIIFPYKKYKFNDGREEGDYISNRSTYRFNIDLFSQNTASYFNTTIEKLKDNITATPVIWKKKSEDYDADFTKDDLIFDDTDRI